MLQLQVPQLIRPCRWARRPLAPWQRQWSVWRPRPRWPSRQLECWKEVEATCWQKSRQQTRAAHRSKHSPPDSPNHHPARQAPEHYRIWCFLDEMLAQKPAYLALVVARMQCKVLQVGFPLKHLAWLWLLRLAATWMLVTLPWNLPILKFPQVELNAPKTIRPAKLSGFSLFHFATDPSPATRRYWCKLNFVTSFLLLCEKFDHWPQQWRCHCRGQDVCRRGTFFQFGETLIDVLLECLNVYWAVKIYKYNVVPVSQLRASHLAHQHIPEHLQQSEYILSK